MKQTLSKMLEAKAQELLAEKGLKAPPSNPKNVLKVLSSTNIQMLAAMSGYIIVYIILLYHIGLLFISYCYYHIWTIVYIILLYHRNHLISAFLVQNVILVLLLLLVLQCSYHTVIS